MGDGSADLSRGAAEPNDVESDQQRQRNCVEGTRRRWYGEDERTGRDEWCSEHRQHRLRIRERAWRTHSAHDPCLTMADRARLLRSRVAAGNDVDGRAFAERCEGDRHHFRFIVSPDDAGELGSYETSPGNSSIRPRAT
jgi:hypothetical protein